MKVSIKIKPETLVLLQRIILISCQVANDRFSQSLRSELWEVLTKKCINYTQRPDGKGKKISLRYHIAHTLLVCGREFLQHRGLDAYEENQLQSLLNELDQKLC